MQPILLDSHLHLDTFDESGDVPGMLERAAAAGVARMIAIGGTVPANQRAIDWAGRCPERLRATVGYDRDEAGRSPDLALLDAMAAGPHIVGIGETGLDYHYLPETAPAQRELFQQMLDLAARRSLPVVIHSREADDDTVAMLKAHLARWKGDPARAGVLHCFTGSLAFARQLLDLGLFISFSGIVTFRNADALREVARFVPEDRILVETDAPYLAPVPLRGKPNEPAYVAHVAQALATVRGVALQVIAQQTTSNAGRLFGWTGDSST
jgi:TatD DNase family protein